MWESVGTLTARPPGVTACHAWKARTISCVSRGVQTFGFTAGNKAVSCVCCVTASSRSPFVKVWNFPTRFGGNPWSKVSSQGFNPASCSADVIAAMFTLFTVFQRVVCRPLSAGEKFQSHPKNLCAILDLGKSHSGICRADHLWSQNRTSSSIDLGRWGKLQFRPADRQIFQVDERSE